MWDMIQLLENEVPANPESDRNQRLMKQLERDLKRYFKDLDNAIDYDRLEQIYYQYVEKD